jgi:hypothetical protein
MRSRPTVIAGLLLGACAVTASGQSSAPASAGMTTRVLPPRLPSVGLPLATWHLVPAMDLLAWYARVPIGFEGLEDDPFVPAPQAGELPLGGDTVAEALDKIVARQPRYGWSEENGVIHLRPTAARADANNLLNRPVAAFELHDVTLPDALHEVHFYLRPELRGGVIVGSGPGPRALGLRRFSVAVSNTTVLGVLDAIVLAQGEASWHVTYMNDPRWPYRIGFGTFDGWGQTW